MSAAACWWKEFDRVQVLAEVESASGRSLSANDPLPDTLIAHAQALGLLPAELRLWIYDEPERGDWSAAALTEWARRAGLGTKAE